VTSDKKKPALAYSSRPSCHLSRFTVYASCEFGSTDLMLVLMTVIWGVNFSAIKYSLEDLLPLSFNGLRFVIASIILLIVALASGINFKVSRGDGWRLFGFGLLANVLYQTLFISGMAHTRTGNAALIVATTPLFTAVIGRIRGQERFTRRGLAGLLMAFAGLVLVIASGGSKVEFGDTLPGDCLLLCSSLCWSLYTVGTHRLLHTYGSLKATTIMMLTGTPVFLAVCAPSFASQDWSRVRPAAWGGVIYSALLAIALACFLWNYGVQKIGSTRTALYSNITPVVAIIIAWLALGEKVTWGQALGAAVIFTGIYFVRSGMIITTPASHIEEEVEEAALGPGKN
jgi:drug/metabolite transporter (DMT)-like permease